MARAPVHDLTDIFITGNLGSGKFSGPAGSSRPFCLVIYAVMSGKPLPGLKAGGVGPGRIFSRAGCGSFILSAVGLSQDGAAARQGDCACAVAVLLLLLSWCFLAVMAGWQVEGGWERYVDNQLA